MTKTKKALIGVAIFVVICLVFVIMWSTIKPPVTITYETFKTELEKGSYKRVYLGIYDVSCSGKDGVRYVFKVTDRAKFDKYVSETIDKLGLETIYVLGEPIKDDK